MYEIGKEYDELVHEFGCRPFLSDYGIRMEDIISGKAENMSNYKEYILAADIWKYGDKIIKDSFEKEIKEKYNVDENVINLAYEIRDCGDNFSYELVEMYIVMIISHLKI